VAQKAIAKIVTPEMVKGVIRRAFTKDGPRGHISFAPPPQLMAAAKQAILDKFYDKFDVDVVIKTKGEADAGEGSAQ